MRICRDDHVPRCNSTLRDSSTKKEDDGTPRNRHTCPDTPTTRSFDAQADLAPPVRGNTLQTHQPESPPIAPPRPTRYLTQPKGSHDNTPELGPSTVIGASQPIGQALMDDCRIGGLGLHTSDRIARSRAEDRVHRQPLLFHCPRWSNRVFSD